MLPAIGANARPCRNSYGPMRKPVPDEGGAIGCILGPFYRLLALAFCFGIAACSQDPPTAVIQESNVFPLGQRTSFYVAPEANEDLVNAWVNRLRKGSRESLRFAKARLADEGQGAAASIARMLESIEGEDALFGAQVNCCAALGAAGDSQYVGLLLGLLVNAEVPVVRSEAAGAIGTLGGSESAPALIAQARREPEEGPRRAIYRALGELNSPVAGEFLEEQVMSWVIRPGASAEGETAWNAMLLLSCPGTVERLARLGAHLPGPLKVQALARRAALGDESVAKELMGFLNSETWPSAGVRSQAVGGLAHAGAWLDVLKAAEDPAPKVRETVARELGKPEAGDLGAEQLAAWASGPESGVRNLAISSLLRRGDENCLGPFLVKLKSFPHGEGSLDALHVLRLSGSTDPRAVPILAARFDSCPPEFQLDIVRVLGTTAAPEAVPILAAVAGDSNKPESLRVAAVSGLGNLGLPSAVDALLDMENSSFSTVWEEAWVSALGRNSKIQPSRLKLLEMLSDQSVPDFRRRVAMEIVPLALGKDAFLPLLVARDSESRAEVAAFLDAILKKYF